MGVMSSTSRALTSKYGCHPQQGEEEGDYWIWSTLCAALCKGQFLLSAVVRSGMMSSRVGGGIHMMALLCMTCSAMNSQNSWIARLTCLTWSIVILSMMVIHGHKHVYLDNGVTSTYIAQCCLFTRLASVWVLDDHCKNSVISPNPFSLSLNDDLFNTVMLGHCWSGHLHLTVVSCDICVRSEWSLCSRLAHCNHS